MGLSAFGGAAALAALALAFAPAIARSQDLSTLAWLAGDWVETKDGTVTEERWTAPAGGLLLATNRVVRADGRASFEFLRIEMREGRPVYLASPGGRPATEFATEESGPQRIVFGNPGKAFPRRIHYWREGEALLAKTEGTIRGEAVTEQWRFERR